MNKKRIDKIIENLPARDHEAHDLNKFLREYKLKNYLKNNNK